MSRPLIDVHTHLMPDLTEAGALPGVTTVDGALVIDGRQIALSRLYDASGLVGFLTESELDRAWVSAPPPAYRQGLPAAECEQWVRSLDAGMRARIAGRPCLDLLSYLPLDQPEVALTLAEETATEARTIGWTASAGGGSVALDDDRLDPLWALLAEVRRPLLLHPGESRDERLDAHYLANLLGNPVETGVAVAQLLLGGVLTRHPGLQVVLVHCAGVVPSVIGRWARGVSTARPGISAGTLDPRESVRALWSDALAHSPAAVDLALSVLGPDRLLLGSDYPFPMGLDDPRDALSHLPSDQARRIAENAAVLLEGRA